MLDSDKKSELQATSALGWLQEKHPGEYDDGLVRTLQRRIRDWRALHGPPKEVFFEQAHVPGREAAFDFTNCDELGVTIARRRRVPAHPAPGGEHDGASGRGRARGDARRW